MNREGPVESSHKGNPQTLARMLVTLEILSYEPPRVSVLIYTGQDESLWVSQHLVHDCFDRALDVDHIDPPEALQHLWQPADR